MKLRILQALASALGFLIVTLLPASAVSPALAGPSASPNCDIGVLKCKVASLNGTAGLQIRFSAIIEDEEEEEEEAPEPGAPINSNPWPRAGAFPGFPCARYSTMLV